MGNAPKRWRVHPAPPQEALDALKDFPPLLARLLCNRGIHRRDEAERFLTYTEASLADPFLLPDMPLAVHRLNRAVLAAETVAVFGDFDVDGVTGTALLARALSRLGVPVVPYIPHRVTEGHGLNSQAVRYLRESGATLLVTVDCGVTSTAEVREATALGMDVIITDHHTPRADLPTDCAVVNPRLDGSRYPFPHLAGAGLALKVAQALLQQAHPMDWHHGLLELAALGTVADVAPLLGENRAIVALGLVQLNKTDSPGLRALLREAGLRPGSLDAEDIGWAIAPRLNAAGRLDHAMASYRLLATESPEQASELAQVLERQNAQRQALTEAALEATHQRLGPLDALGPLLMVDDEGFAPGIIGLIAGKLAEEFHRPAIAVSRGPEESLGSCRSIAEFNLAEALETCADLFIRFGGHPQAAGFTIPTHRLPELRQRLTALAAQRLTTVSLQPVLDIDAEVRLADLGGTTYRDIQMMAPFGPGNPHPVFLSRGVEVARARALGDDGRHTRLKLRDGPLVWDAVAFRQAVAESVRRSDLVYTLGVDAWNSDPTLRLTVLDWRPAL